MKLKPNAPEGASGKFFIIHVIYKPRVTIQRRGRLLAIYKRIPSFLSHLYLMYLQKHSL